MFFYSVKFFLAQNKILEEGWRPERTIVLKCLEKRLEENVLKMS